jgi:uncharacterized membrane protein YqaE (UPF0057 family)
MRAVRFTLFLSLAFVITMPQSWAAVAPKPDAAQNQSSVVNDTEAFSAEREMTKAEKRQLRKQLKDRIKDMRRSGETELALLVIIAILIPPVAMAIHDNGITGRFWISLLLTLLFYLPGLIYTLVVILGERS